MKKRLLALASGGRNRDQGGTGIEQVVLRSRSDDLRYEVVGIVSNYPDGGVRHRADKLSVPFRNFPSPWDAAGYQRLVEEFKPDLITLSGWLKYVVGLNPAITSNIHPGWTQKPFGGHGMHGDIVHQKVLEDFERGILTHTAVSMHFVTQKIDGGPVFFQAPIPVKVRDTVATLKQRVNSYEHHYQAMLLDLLAGGEIHWDGQDPRSLVVPSGIASFLADAMLHFPKAPTE
ncbi:MAG: formyltransferase family protein [bacterium]|nr:formyltransferase family protein [bacterium]